MPLYQSSIKLVNDLGGTPSLPTVVSNHADHWVVAKKQGAGGTETVTVANPGAFAAAWVTAAATHTAALTGTWGDNVGGIVNATGANASLGTISSSYGSFIHGYALASTATTSITASYSGGFAQGYATDGSILSANKGAFAQGRAATSSSSISSTGIGAFSQGYAINGGLITSTTYGTFAQGYANTKTISAAEKGAFAQGNVASGTGSIISSYGVGSFAQGYANAGAIKAQQQGSFGQGVAIGGGSIAASGVGALARGRTGGHNITASANATFAHGDATAADIIASATNAVQFGPGTNAQADSFQIGNAGIRFKGTTGAPGTPQLGDVWIASSKVVHNGALSLNADTTWDLSTHGPVLVDTTDGHTYRLKTTAGVVGTVQVT